MKRVRLSTVMLLVVIVALSLALAFQQWHAILREREHRADLQLLRAELFVEREKAQAASDVARAQIARLQRTLKRQEKRP